MKPHVCYHKAVPHSVILESQCYHTVFRQPTIYQNYVVIVLSQCDFRITVLPHCV